MEKHFSMKKLQELVEKEDVDQLKSYMKEHNLKLEGTKIVPVDKSEYKHIESYWDQRQQARKILLNSLYGALLNIYCRFNDDRLGQSVTLSGRSITGHMIAKANEIIEGEYNYKGKSIKYSDTDSVYFSAYSVLKDDPAFQDFEWNKENVIQLYDQIADEVNNSFCDYMIRAFNVSEKRGNIIQAARETCGTAAIFNMKKRYGIMVYDDEGKRKDVDGKPGEIKAMGMEIKRSDTPKPIQKFLEGLLEIALTTMDEDQIEDQIIQAIRDYREKFNDMNSWEKGSPKAVNKLTEYHQKEIKAGKKTNMPGHVRASINFNKLLELNGDRYTQPITDGAKIVVCKLRDNKFKMKSIAYPVDENHLPRWFRELPFDDDGMEQTLIDQKVKNLLYTLPIDLTKAETKTTFNDLFE